MSKSVARFGLSKDASTCLKGLACLLIVLHHWCNAMMTVWQDNLLIDTVALRGGVTGVAIFFFLSSYGLTRSQSGRHDGVLAFFKKRLVKVLIPLLFTNVLWFMFQYHGQGFVHSICQLLNLCDLLDKVTWFCNVIIACYVVFYVSYLVGPLWGRICCNWVLTLLFAVIFTYCWPNDSYLVYSLVAFPLGFTIATLQDQMKPLSLIFGVCLTTVTVLGCLGLIVCRHSQLYVANLYSAAIILVMLFLWHVCSRNRKTIHGLRYIKPALLTLGLYSYEVYLLHNKALMLHSQCGTSIWFPLSFLIAVIPLSVLLYHIDHKISLILSK